MDDDARTHGISLFESMSKELLFVKERNDGRKAEGEEIPKEELNALREIHTSVQKVDINNGDVSALTIALLKAAVAPRNADLVLSRGLMREINGFLSLHDIP